MNKKAAPLLLGITLLLVLTGILSGATIVYAFAFMFAIGTVISAFLSNKSRKRLIQK